MIDLGIDTDRFMGKVRINESTECWEWTAYLADHGYGYFWMGGKNRRAHRVAYAARNGKIATGLVIDHLCRTRHCVNPDHLEAVSPGENIRRGETGLRNAAKTHCPRGHEYNDENTYVRKSRKSRVCRLCARDRQRESAARRRSVR